MSSGHGDDTNLLVIDVLAGNDKGGNEIMRKVLDESKLLAHTV